MTLSLSVFQQSATLLRNPNLSQGQIRNLLFPVGFANWQHAHRCLLRLADLSPQAREALADGLRPLFIAISGTAAPDQTLVHFERFVQAAGDPTALLAYLAANPRGFEVLATLFNSSQFLTEILQRHPEYFEALMDVKQLAQPKERAELCAEIFAIIQPFLENEVLLASDDTPALNTLRRYQRRELLRIGSCDLLGLLDLPTVTAQLSYLADSLTEAALLLAGQRTHTDPQGFAVLGMGKLGGTELNYSSDVDLIFLVDADPRKYFKLGQQLIDILARNTPEGFLYRVDMRLRPWGRSGVLVNTVDAHVNYLRKHANLWERQALLKARTIAGNQDVGQAFLRQAHPIIFDTGNEPLRAGIHQLKQRIEAQLSKRRREWGEVKLGQGSIRDIEFVTQYLQLAHGPGSPGSQIDSANTITALAGLSNAGYLPPAEYRVLTDGYIFLRTIEHHLQLMHYRQTHTLPDDGQALNHLAQRLGFQGSNAGSRFRAQYQQHTAVIRAVYQRHLVEEALASRSSSDSSPNLLPLLMRMHPSYVVTFSDADIMRHALLMEELTQENLVKVEAVPLDAEHWQVTIVGFDYLGVLSLICGLLVVYGFDIVDGHVFSYGPDLTPAEPQKKQRRGRTTRSIRAARSVPERKIVDVLTVRPIQPGTTKSTNRELWTRYDDDLTALFHLLDKGQQRKAHGELAKRVALALPQTNTAAPQLYPVDIDIDNDASDRHTVLQIDSLDTFGFLYEFTNALALANINVRRMTVASQGNRVQDILYVTNAANQKITSSQKQRELRATIVLIKHFTHLLPQSPNPEAALLHFREFVGQLLARPDWPSEITSLEETGVLTSLARLLGVSDFLWNDFLRMQHANLFPMVRDAGTLAEARLQADLREELAITLANTPNGEARRDALNAFKDREMFRIDLRQIQGFIREFGQFSAELTDLAEVIVEAAYQLALEILRPQFGLPRLDSGATCALSICALGKCGGRELGFASDIELMFIFAGGGKTTGPRVVTTAEFFTKVVQEVDQIIQTKREGIFELDLRLRPYGSAGSMGVSLEAFESYFGPDGDAWPYERQALVKLRPIGGDVKLGQQLTRLRDAMIYTGEPFDVTAMRAMRERQLRHLVTAGTIHAKFSPGALVDVEYLVQGLQITYGHHDPSLRTPNTLKAIQALAAARVISTEDFPRLVEAYTFLRNLINALRMVRGNAKDLTVPPTGDEEFAFLARRLNYTDNVRRLQHDLTRHTTYVEALSQRLLKWNI